VNRYTFDRFATANLNGSFTVSRRDEVTGYYTTWYVEPDPVSHTGWRIWRPTPSNRPLTITPTGTLGKRILAVVRATQERFGNQAVEGVR
jgi:hypothetical protein